MTLRTWRAPLSLLLVSASLPVAAGCGGGNGSSSSATTTTQATATAPAASGPAVAAAKVKMAGFAFGPKSVTVKAGGTVTWTNADATPHTATADDQKTFDSGTVNTGKSKTVAFKKPGTYTYFCRFHPFMHGTVVVQ